MWATVKLNCRCDCSRFYYLCLEFRFLPNVMAEPYCTLDKLVFILMQCCMLVSFSVHIHPTCNSEIQAVKYIVNRQTIGLCHFKGQRKKKERKKALGLPSFNAHTYFSWLCRKIYFFCPAYALAQALNTDHGTSGGYAIARC